MASCMLSDLQSLQHRKLPHHSHVLNVPKLGSIVAHDGRFSRVVLLLYISNSAVPKQRKDRSMFQGFQEENNVRALAFAKTLAEQRSEKNLHGLTCALLFFFFFFGP